MKKKILEQLKIIWKCIETVFLFVFICLTAGFYLHMGWDMKETKVPTVISVTIPYDTYIKD